MIVNSVYTTHAKLGLPAWRVISNFGDCCDSTCTKLRPERERSRLVDLIWTEVANDEFQQNRCSRGLPFSVIYHKTAWTNLLEKNLRNSIQCRCQAYQTTCSRNFQHLL
ncbi:hypothetical protein TNCV_3303971 [Trichonephila clavipes]|nr:hypothetical protein TNCV_3303971 [Trichonephila clavipes]